MPFLSLQHESYISWIIKCIYFLYTKNVYQSKPIRSIATFNCKSISNDINIQVLNYIWNITYGQAYSKREIWIIYRHLLNTFYLFCVFFPFDFIVLDLVFVISYCNRPYEHAINVLISSTHKKSFGRWKT